MLGPRWAAYSGEHVGRLPSAPPDVRLNVASPVTSPCPPVRRGRRRGTRRVGRVRFSRCTARRTSRSGTRMPSRLVALPPIIRPARPRPPNPIDDGVRKGAHAGGTAGPRLVLIIVPTTSSTRISSARRRSPRWIARPVPGSCVCRHACASGRTTMTGTGRPAGGRGRWSPGHAGESAAPVEPTTTSCALGPSTRARPRDRASMTGHLHVGVAVREAPPAVRRLLRSRAGSSRHP